MNILLVYPAQLDSSGKPLRYKKAYLPPLSLAIINSLTPERHRVSIVNEFVEQIDFSAEYDLVGISALTPQAPRAYQIGDAFRSKGTKVIIGGVHASMLPEEAGRHADSVVVGEVEDLWAKILGDCENDRLQPRYKSENKPSLEKLVIPKWDSINLDIYRTSAGKRRMPRMPLFTTRGCLYNCTFCSVSKFYGQSHRFKPVSNVLKEIDAVNADSYFFVDDNIICDPDYAEELFRALEAKDIRWFSQASTNILDNPHLIDLAAKAGSSSLFFGIESITRKNLLSLNKGFNRPDRYVELFRRLEKAGIRPWVSLIYGLDDDDGENLRLTLDFLIKNRVANIVLCIYTPLPGTDLYVEMTGDNRIREYNWSLYDLRHVVFNPVHFSPEALLEKYWRDYQKLYSVGNIIRKMAGLKKNTGKSVNALFKDFKIQFFTNKQLRAREHPYSMGIGRIKN